MKWLKKLFERSPEESATKPRGWRTTGEHADNFRKKKPNEYLINKGIINNANKL